MGARLADHPVDGREEEGTADGPEPYSSTILRCVHSTKVGIWGIVCHIGEAKINQMDHTVVVR